MTRHDAPHRSRPSRRRVGGIYIAVMAAVLVVTLIGMSAVLAARIERRTAAANEDAVRARFYARSFAEIVVQRLDTSTTWRTDYANNTWSTAETVDGARVQFRLIDETDGDLTDDSTEAFRVQAKATYGSATRSISMSVQPPTFGSGGPPPNKIENGGMETFASTSLPPTRWYHYPSGPGETSGTGSRSGARNGRIYNRLAATEGLSQDMSVTSLRKGATYDLKAYVKYATAAGTVKVGLILTDSTGATTKYQFSKLTVLNLWNEVSGTITPTWSGTLTSARFSVESGSGTGELRADDVTLTEQRGTTTLSVISGSIRRDLAD